MDLGIVVPMLGHGVVECLVIGCPLLISNPSPTFVMLIGRGITNEVGARILMLLLMVFL